LGCRLSWLRIDRWWAHVKAVMNLGLKCREFLD